MEHKIHIAIVNGMDRDMEKILPLFFKKMRGDDVTACFILDQIWELVQSHPPDIIWLFWSPLRDKNGFISEIDACKRLRAVPETSTIPIVISTQRCNVKEEAWAAGADAYLSLPASPAVYLTVRDAILRGEKQVCG